MRMNAFFHIPGRNKILFPPPPVQTAACKKAAVLSPFLMYPLRKQVNPKSVAVRNGSPTPGRPNSPQKHNSPFGDGGLGRGKVARGAQLQVSVKQTVLCEAEPGSAMLAQPRAVAAGPSPPCQRPWLFILPSR